MLTLITKGQQIFDRVGPDSELRYAEIESEFGQERLEQLYTLLADFCTTLSTNES